MPETNEGKLQLMELKTKLDDHVNQQNVDMSEVKSGITRIETKLDIKADKDEIDKVANALSQKADKEQLDRLDSRFWAIVMAIIIAFIGLIVTAVQTFFRKVAFLCGYGGDAAPVIQIVDGEVWDGYSDGTGGDSQVYYRLYSGWEVQRRITLTDISVIDDSNTAISGATVKIYSAGASELASGTTDASGEIADQEVIAYEFDNDTGSLVTYQSSTNLNSATTDNIPLRIVVSKAGYDDSTRYVSSYKGPFKVGKITLYKKSGGVKTVSAGILNYGQGN